MAKYMLRKVGETTGFKYITESDGEQTIVRSKEKLDEQLALWNSYTKETCAQRHTMPEGKICGLCGNQYELVERKQSKGNVI